MIRTININAMNIRIPLPQKVSLNEIYTTHWRKRQNLIKLYHESLIEYRGKNIKEYPVDITYIFYFKGRLLDCDNCVAMGKLLTDSLCHWKILKDDSPSYIQSLTIMSTKSATRHDEVEIIII